MNAATPDPTTYRGSCLCGQVRFSAIGPADNVRCCHCRNCQRVAGGPFFARAIFTKADVKVVGETARYRSSQRLWRVFCPQCSALLFSEPVDRPTYLGIALASLDEPSALSPDMHIWTSSKVEWLKLDDSLPQHLEGLPW
jgi:hypothetical protein